MDEIERTNRLIEKMTELANQEKPSVALLASLVVLEAILEGVIRMTPQSEEVFRTLRREIERYITSAVKIKTATDTTQSV